jgi:hypothetical protein
MMKMKLLTTVLIVLVAVGVVTAAEVINVDIRGYGNNAPYVGNGAYNVGPNAVWTAYYGGFGVPVGSARSEGLVPSSTGGGLGFFCSVYAAQVWIGDDGDHDYEYGSGLMNDGFVANPSLNPNPKLHIFGQDAYQGIYDIYVYGRDAGSFTLNYYGTPTTKTVDGTAPAGTFVQGGNYVIFSNVDINNANSNDVYLTYTNQLNALQLVKKKDPVNVQNGTIIAAANWDVAGERNIRSDDPHGFGPDIAGTEVGYLETGEFMGYDINVDAVNQGRYWISIDVNTAGLYNANPLRIYLDDKVVGDVCDCNLITIIGKTTDVSVNLFKGNHTVKWHLPFQAINQFPHNGTTGFDVVDVNFTRIGSIAMTDCNEVDFYSANYPADLSGNCTVGLEDLALMVNNWLICNNPDQNGCF